MNNVVRWRVYVYWIFGLFLINVSIIIRYEIFMIDKPLRVLVLSSILPLCLLVIMRIFKKKYLSISPTKRAILIFLLGPIISFFSGIIFFDQAIGTIFGTGTFFSLISATILLFDSFNDLKQEGLKLRKALLTQKPTEIEKNRYLDAVKYIHDESKYLLDKTLLIISCFGAPLFTVLSVILTYAAEVDTLEIFYVQSFVIFTVYVYSLLGIIIWLVFPLLNEIKYTRQILTKVNVHDK